MYPHVVQFETRRLELEQGIRPTRDRRKARRGRANVPAPASAGRPRLRALLHRT